MIVLICVFFYILAVVCAGKVSENPAAALGVIFFSSLATGILMAM